MHFALRFACILTLSVTSLGLGCKKPSGTSAQDSADPAASSLGASSATAAAVSVAPVTSTAPSASTIPSAIASSAAVASASSSRPSPSASGSASAKKSSSTIPVCGSGASLFVNDQNKTVCSQHCDSDKDCKGGMKCTGAMGVPADPKTGNPEHPGNAGVTPICAYK